MEYDCRVHGTQVCENQVALPVSTFSDPKISYADDRPAITPFDAIDDEMPQNAVMPTSEVIYLYSLYKQKKLAFYQELIEGVEAKMGNSTASTPLDYVMGVTRVQTIAGSVPGLVTMYDRIEQSKINSLLFERVFAVMSPIVAAIVAPLIVSYLSRPEQ